MEKESNSRAVELADMRLLLKPEECALALAVSRARVYEMLASGDLPSVKIGRSRRIPVAALKRWVERETELASE